jgi:predicted phage tail protein
MDTATRAVVATIPTVVSRLGVLVGASAAIVATPAASTVPGSTPTNFRATSIVGNRLTLAWNAPTSGSPTGYVIEGGVAPGQVLGSLATGSTATTLSFDAPTGAFYLRVHALTASGKSGPSNEIYVVVNVAQAPSAPANLLGLANGANLALSWKATSSGGPPTSQILDVSGAITTSVPLPLGEMFSFAGVPPGTYTFAVRAANSAGTSPPSSPVTLTFPSACPGPPEVPTNFVVSRNGSQLTISWDPPTAGPAVASYVLKVADAFDMAVPMSARSISGNVPSGTYILSVLAVNACGSGVETAQQSVTVP